MNEVINDEDNIAKTVERNRERKERKENRSSLKSVIMMLLKHE